MTNLIKLPTASDDGHIHVVVETPRGAKAKLRYEPSLKVFVMSKSLIIGLTYPYDWGFIPSTIAEDGDPVDALIIHEASTFPGLVLRCKLIGVLQVMQKSKNKQERNDRVIAVPMDSHLERSLHDARKLPSQIKEELEKFFIATDELQDKTIKFQGWHGPNRAMKLTKDGMKQFAKRQAE